ncbi:MULTISPECIES: GNAT family N-acetyltransferase [Flavobacterium]|uniref:GNAT family N-acetyltransferase n=1 Tax=Flavobacterium resistens TaxID=443612 RepID=A0A521ECX5_9FLAO|nr:MULTISPECIES: GNAT family N-acetyltransferase [Flavobacterium]MDQ6471503.1 GNAT family N-acetyltransferase [Flavobacterium sp. LHD-80]MRX68949.1 GNAT family N-acetyltransferase [Flavobacterium resistens]MTH16928.1 GNAT family N-acetyltransferase [Flavobacterium sp. LC2016-01]SMO81768.1 Ribosomal protein S18 acetylase RimI [Flavobacterium resistens]
MNIRKGNPEDMKSVLGLIQELAIFEKEPEAVVITEEDLVRDGFGEKPLFQVFVAEIESDSEESKNGKEIVGIALYYYRYSTWKGKTIHLEDLIVKEKMRGTGLGSALYAEIMKQGKKDNVRRVEWNVLAWNTPAVNFYKNSGARILEDWQVVQMDEAGVNSFLEKL